MTGKTYIAYSNIDLNLIGLEYEEDKIRFYFVNSSDKDFSHVKVKLTFKDDDNLLEEREFIKEGIAYPKGKRVSFSMDYEMKPSCKQVYAHISGYKHDGGEEAIDEKGLSFYPVENISALQREKIQEEFGKDTFSYAEDFGKVWRCSCGTLNAGGEDECRSCQRNKTIVLKNQTRRAIQSGSSASSQAFGENQKLASAISLRNRSQEESKRLEESEEEKKRLEKEAQEAKEEAERLKRQREKEKEKERERKKKEEELRKKRRDKGINDEPRFWDRFMILPAWKKTLITVLTGLIVALALIFATNSYENYNWNRTVQAADAAVNSRDFDRAISLYYRAQEIKDTDQLKEKVQHAAQMRDSQEAFDRAEQYLKDGDHVSACRDYLKVIKEDANNYKKAQERIGEIEASLKDRVQALIDQNDFGGASLLVNNYLSVKPDSELALSLQKSIEEARDKKAEEDKQEEEERKKALEEAKKAAEEAENKRKEAEDKAKKAEEDAKIQRRIDDLSGKMNYIDGEAEVYESASSGSRILGVAEDGESAYVYEAKAEGSTVWAYVQVTARPSSQDQSDDEEDSASVMINETYQVTGWVRASNLKN